MAVTALVLAACSQLPRTQPVPRAQPVTPDQPVAVGQSTSASQSAVPGRQAVPAGAEQSPAGPAIASAEDGLNDLAASTSGCPKAALNAAAREAARAPTEGSYRFSYFQVISDSHHALYEVRFKSNYEAEPDLKYCVAMYCQQGWDPKTARINVTPIGVGRERRPAGTAARAGAPAGLLAQAPVHPDVHAAAAGSATCSSRLAPLKPRVRR